MLDDGARTGDARDLRVGSFVGKYEIVRVIGSGGMGVLYEARHPVLANRLAIKTLRAALALDGAERFRNEALAASRLRDDRLPQIFDIDQLEDGTQYIVMEYLDGEDLARRLARGALDPGYAARLMFEVLELLSKVHTLGIVHRDIKPANIFIARSTLFGEIPKLLDFGVAHIASATMTFAGQVLGTPAYMAPEQAIDIGRVGPWTDVFSAAVVLFELIAGPGERPWVAAGLHGHISTLAGTVPPRALGGIAPWTPPRLCEAIERALQRDPAKRYQSALDFARAIEPWALDRSVLYKAPPPEGSDQPAASDPHAAPPTSAALPALRSSIEMPLVAKKVAELRGAFARMKPGTAARSKPPRLEEQLQPGERRLVVIVYVQAQLQRGGGELLIADDQEQLMAQFLDLFSQELSQHGAQVAGQPDAGLVGVFGDERLREDDAERAMAAALSIDRRRVEANLLLTDIGYAVATRIGVHRGFVARRAGADARMPIAGDTIGLARRLSEGAPLNGIVASADAVDGLRDWLLLQPFTRLKIPGRAHAVEVHEVLGTATEGWGGQSDTFGPTLDARSAAAGQIPKWGARVFVGRDEALAQLRDVFARMTARPERPDVVAVTGAPGMGKTRLVGEFLARLGGESRSSAPVVRVQPPPRVSYGLWGSLLELLIGRVASLDANGGGADAAFGALVAALDGERRELLVQQRGVVDLLVGRGVEEFAGRSPQQMGDRIQLAVTLCIAAAARLLGRPSQPLVIVLENLHRADPASLALVPKVVPAIRAEVAPLFLLTMRDALPHHLPQDAMIVELGPLSGTEAAALAASVAGSMPSPAVQQLMVRRAGGNPLFIEQLVVMLREEGLLGASDAQLGSVAPPVSLYGVFLERVDRLESALGEALRLGSVLGVEFEHEVYAAVYERAAPASGSAAPGWTAGAALDELVARGFLVHIASTDGGMYAFEPAQMQAAMYGTILTENRQILHALAAESVERFHADRPARHLARILHHYGQSGNIEQTVRFARLAGERALAMAAYDEAAEHLATAVALQDRVPGAIDLIAAETLHNLATACQWRGLLRQAVSRVEEAVARLSAGNSEPADDRRRVERLARLAMTLGDLNGLLGAWDRSIECYAKAERRFSDGGMHVDAAEARCCRGFSHRARGQPEQGVVLAREGWAVLEATGDPAAIARAGHELGNLLRDLGRYDEALRIFDRAVASGEDLRRAGRMSESTWGSLAARSGRAMTYAAMGNMAAAIADQQAVVDLARRDGNRVAQAISEYHLAEHYLEQGDLQSADEAAERAYRQCRGIDMPGRALKCRVVQARGRARGGNWEGAVERIKDAFAVAERGRVPEDGLINAVDLLLSAGGHVPQELLVQAVRIAWPHASQKTSDQLRPRVAALTELLGLDDVSTTGGVSTAAPLNTDDEVTRL